MAPKRKAQAYDPSDEERLEVAASSRRNQLNFIKNNTQPEHITKPKEKRNKRKFQQKQERQRKTYEKVFSPITRLLLENIQTFLKQTEHLTKIDQHAQGNIHTKTQKDLAEFKLEHVFMTVVNIARHVETETLKKIDWRPSELLNIVQSTLEKGQGHTAGNRKTLCLDPEDTKNFLCGDEESNKLAVRMWDTLLTWDLDEAAAAHSETKNCSCSRERILRLELRMMSDPKADCMHTERVMKFRDRVSKILIRYLLNKTSFLESSPGHFTRSKSGEKNGEMENDELAQKQLWTEDARRMIREDTSPVVAKDQSSELPIEVTKTELAFHQSSSNSFPSSGVETTYIHHHTQQSIMGTMISEANQSVGAVLKLGETSRISNEKPRAEIRAWDIQALKDFHIIEREIQTRTTAIRAEMKESITQWMNEKERLMEEQLRNFCISEIHLGIQNQSLVLQKATNSVSTVQVEDLLAQIAELQTGWLHQRSQVEQVTGSMAASLRHEAEEAAMLQKRELAEIQEKTNERIATTSQEDLDRHRAMQLKTAKTRTRHDAEIQYLRLMAEEKATGIMERLENIENANKALNAGLEDQSVRLTEVTIDLKRMKKDNESTKIELQDEILYQRSQVEQAQQQVEGALTERIESLRKEVETDAILRKTELTKIQEKTNERITTTSQEDLDRHRAMQLKTAKTRTRHDAEIQYLRLMAEEKATGIMERLENIENANNDLSTGLKDQSEKLTEVARDLNERLRKDDESTKIGLRAEIDSSLKTYTAQVIKESTPAIRITEDRLKNLEEAKSTIEDGLDAQKSATAELWQQIAQKAKELEDLVSRQNIDIQLQPLNDIIGVLTKKVNIIQKNVKEQTQDIQTLKTLKTLKTPKNPKTSKARKYPSQSYALRTNAIIKDLRTAVIRLEERDRALSVNFKQAKTLAGRTFVAKSNRTRRLEIGLAYLRNSRAKEPDLQAQLDGLGGEIAKINLFIQEARILIENKMEEFQLQLNERNNEITEEIDTLERQTKLQWTNTRKRLNNHASETSTVNQSLRDEATIVKPTSRRLEDEMPKTTNDLEQLGATLGSETPRRSGLQVQLEKVTVLEENMRKMASQLKDLELKIKATVHQDESFLHRMMDTIRTKTESEKLETIAEFQNHQKAAQISPDIDRFRIETSLLELQDAQKTSHDKLNTTLKTVQDVKRLQCNSKAHIKRLQVQCENLETEMKRILEIFPNSNGSVGSLYIMKEGNTANDQVGSMQTTREYQDRFERPLENHSQALKDMKDTNTDISLSLDRCPTSEADAAGQAIQPERRPTINNPTMRHQTNSTEPPKKRLHNLVEVPPKEDTVCIDEAAIKSRADRATIGNEVEAQLAARTEKTKILEQDTESPKCRNKASDKASETTGFEQSACGYQTSQKEMYHQNEDDGAITNENAMNEPSGLVWAFQKLEEKDGEILRVIDHYEKQRSKHLQQCQAYFDHTKAKTEQLKDQVKQLKKGLDYAVQQIKHRDGYIASMSKAEDVRHENSDLGENGDKQANIDSALASNRKQTDPKPHCDEISFEVDGGKTEPRLKENSGATIATRGRPKARKHTLGTTQEGSAPKTATKLKREKISSGTSHSVSSKNPVNTVPLKNIPSHDDNVDYLQPGFDPYSIRVEDLRRIFVAHEIKFSWTLKKHELVDLFKEKVEPLACATLKKRETIKATAKGITDVKP